MKRYLFETSVTKKDERRYEIEADGKKIINES